MIHVKNILYATDFSPYSNQAYFHAVGLAETYKATLTIVHVYTPTPVAPLSAELVVSPPLSPDDQDYWRGQLEQIRPLNPAIPVRHVFLVGDPAEEIVSFATSAHMELIVLGTHGRTGLERLLMGSVAEKVLRGALCSVLVVKMPKSVPAVTKTETTEARTTA
jgi:nucleotide-binding universal stress UspA family protein